MKLRQPAIAWAKPRSIGVKDAGNSHVDPVFAVHGHGQALRKTLGLVIHTSGSGGSDVASVTLNLRVNLRVAVYLTRAGHEEARFMLLASSNRRRVPSLPTANVAMGGANTPEVRLG